MMTFRQFQATRTDCADVSPIISADFYDAAGNVIAQPVYLYAGDAYIEKRDGGQFALMLGREEYCTPAVSLETLEALLYAWCLTECGDELGCTEAVRDFVCNLQDNMTPEQFAAALLKNAADPSGSVCAMQDYCDANQCALDAAEADETRKARSGYTPDGGDIIDRADAIYNAARPFIRGEA